MSSSARALLATVISGPLDESVRARILEETHGHPLALLELYRGRSAAGPRRRVRSSGRGRPAQAHRRSVRSAAG